MLICGVVSKRNNVEDRRVVIGRAVGLPVLSQQSDILLDVWTRLVEDGLDFRHLLVAELEPLGEPRQSVL